MIRHILIATILILVINIERTCSLKPPQNFKMVGSKLRWTPSNDDNNVLYSLQYNRNSSSEDKWLNVSGHFRTMSRFHITPEFYGAVFRVRAENGSNVSEWQYSDLVKCVNVESCGPLTNLIVMPERIYLTIAHMDKSLEDEYGEHLEFNISWKKDSGGNPEEHYELTNNKYKDFTKLLESGQSYCFQVKYVLYQNPHGNASKEICRIIPETSEEVRRRVLFYAMLTTVLVLAVCGVAIFVLFKHHKKMKRLLQPFQLEIPEHYREVLYNGFPVQVCPSPSSQSLRSYDMITVIENSNAEQNGQKEEQEERSLT